jgi:hypothetical protein
MHVGAVTRGRPDFLVVSNFRCVPGVSEIAIIRFRPRTPDRILLWDQKQNFG